MAEETKIDTATREKTEVIIPETTTETKEKTFTQKDIDAIVAERIKRERKVFEKEKSEIEKLATMTAEEKEREKFKKEKEEFENEKRQINKEKMTIQTGKELEKLEIPADLAKFIVAEDAEDVNENIKTLSTAWKKALEEAVNKKIAGKTPTSGTTQGLSEEEKIKQRIFQSAGLRF